MTKLMRQNNHILLGIDRNKNLNLLLKSSFAVIIQLFKSIYSSATFVIDIYSDGDN